MTRLKEEAWVAIVDVRAEIARWVAELWTDDKAPWDALFVEPKIEIDLSKTQMKSLCSNEWVIKHSNEEILSKMGKYAARRYSFKARAPRGDLLKARNQCEEVAQLFTKLAKSLPK